MAPILGHLHVSVDRGWPPQVSWVVDLPGGGLPSHLGGGLGASADGGADAGADQRAPGRGPGAHAAWLMGYFELWSYSLLDWLLELGGLQRIYTYLYIII